VSAAAGALVTACRDPNDGIRAMAALLPLLVRSGTVERADASHALGCRAEDLDHVLDGLSFRVEKNEQGKIVGAGLTSIPTDHRFRIGGHDRYVWCALDTLLFPAVLGMSAEVESVCAVTGEPIRFRALPHGVEEPSPSTIQVVLVPPAASCDDLRSAFCDQVVFIRDAGHAARYVSTRANAWAVTLADASKLAAHMASAAGAALGPVGGSGRGR
jgi:alkylmercury lyase